MRSWQGKHKQDARSFWSRDGAPALFRAAERCDFRPQPASPLFFQLVSVPPVARGQPSGGDSGGCGAPAAPGAADELPDPLSPAPLPPDALPSPVWIMDHVPDGAALLQEYERSRRAQQRHYDEQVAAQERTLQMIRDTASYRQLACWAEASRASPGRYLPGCSSDGCAEHGSQPAAVAVCEALGETCGGVTVSESRGSYQTRVGPALRSGPADETSWVKKKCPARVERARDPRWAGDQLGEDIGDDTSLCGACAALVAVVQQQLGTRRRTEAEVISTIDGVCGALLEVSSKIGRQSTPRTLQISCSALIERYADELETALVAASPSSKPSEVCVEALPDLCG